MIKYYVIERLTVNCVNIYICRTLNDDKKTEIYSPSATPQEALQKAIDCARAIGR
jgi:hypothetical protein